MNQEDKHSTINEAINTIKTMDKLWMLLKQENVPSLAASIHFNLETYGEHLITVVDQLSTSLMDDMQAFFMDVDKGMNRLSAFQQIVDEHGNESVIDIGIVEDALTILATIDKKEHSIENWDRLFSFSNSVVFGEEHEEIDGNGDDISPINWGREHFFTEYINVDFFGNLEDMRDKESERYDLKKFLRNELDRILSIKNGIIAHYGREYK